MTRLKVTVTSAIILAVLTLQAIAALNALRSISRRIAILEPDPFMWPFMGYPMYSPSHHLGDEIAQYSVIALLPDSTGVPVTPLTLNAGFWIWRRSLVNVLRSDSRSTPEKVDMLRPIARMLGVRHDYEVVGFRLEDRPLILMREGVREGAPRVVGTVWLEPAEGGS